jgi:L-threonylcarbamoyladenylate synthase
MSRHARRTMVLDADIPGDVALGARLLQQGGLVAFPTETVYGLGALALDPLAVRAIYAAKGRPSTNPIIVHVASQAQAQTLCADWPAAADALCAAFWPGPLTLVLPRRAIVSDEVTAGAPTVAVRAPSHPVARDLIARCGGPIAAPSANRSEHVSPTRASHVLDDLGGAIDALLDGGDCPFGIESTVLTLAHGPPRILRPGALGRAAIEAVIGPVALGPLPAIAAGTGSASPGMHARHYAPAGLVHLVPSVGLGAQVQSATAILEAALGQGGGGRLPGLEAGATAVGVLLCGRETAAPAGAKLERLSGDPALYARGLYSALRTLEDRGCATVIIEEVPDRPEWAAIRDRLHRAAGR